MHDGNGDEIDGEVERRLSARLIERRLFDLENDAGEIRSDLEDVKRKQTQMTMDVTALPGRIKTEVRDAIAEDKTLPAKIKTEVQNALNDERIKTAMSAATRNTRIRSIVAVIAAVVAATAATAGAIAAFTRPATIVLPLAAPAAISTPTPYPGRH